MSIRIDRRITSHLFPPQHAHHDQMLDHQHTGHWQLPSTCTHLFVQTCNTITSHATYMPVWLHDMGSGEFQP